MILANEKTSVTCTSTHMLIQIYDYDTVVEAGTWNTMWSSNTNISHAFLTPNLLSSDHNRQFKTGEAS